jgi:trigger factor
MLTSQKKEPNSRVHLVITASAAEFRHAFEHEVQHAANDTKIQGFRPGKAPAAKVIEQVGRQRLEAGAIDHALSHAYAEAMQEAKLVPINNPKVEVTDFTLPGDDTPDDAVAVTFSVEVDVVPEVEVKDYKEIRVARSEIEPVTDQDIATVVKELAEQRSRLEEVAADAKVDDGDWVEISFAGSVDGVAREDMASDAHPVIIGKGSLIPGFEEELIGLKVGEEKSFPIVFPKEYHAQDLAGNKATFTVTINQHKRVVRPEVDDAFAISYGQKSLADLQKMVKENLEEERKNKQQADLEEAVLDALLERTTLELPQSLVEQEVERVIADNKERFQRMQVEWDAYLADIKKTEADIRADIRPQAEKNVKIGLAMGKIIQIEKIDASSEKAMRVAMDKLIATATQK